MTSNVNTPQSALVTGAGSGIGRATALLLAAHGYAVTLVGRREEPLREVAAEIAAAGNTETLVVPCDVGEPGGTGVQRMLDTHVRRFGRLDALVNNAGLGRVLSVGETTPAALEEIVRVNALAVGWAIHAAWPIFRKQFEREGRGGCIINISSMASIDPFPGFFAYGAAKAAVNLLTVSAAQEGQSIGTRVFTLAPGAVETPMLRSAFDESVAPPEICLSPGDVARVVLAYIRGERDADNGKTIPVLSEPAKQWYDQWRRDNPLGWITEPV